MTYDTSDLPLATTLICYGFRLLNVDKTNPKRAVFQFEIERDGVFITKIVDLYFAKGAAIEPSYFFAQIKFLKSKIYADATREGK